MALGMALSELQISLIGLGSVGIVAVWAYNKWQERRHRKAAERVFRGDQPDVLLNAQPSTVEKASAENKEQVRVEPVLATTDAEPEVALDASFTTPAMLASNPSLEMLDPEIEAVVRLDLAYAVPAPRIRDLQRPLAERLSKPLRWVGLAKKGHWDEIGDVTVFSYRHLRAGLLLANRQGALSETELQDYCQGIQELAHRLTATLEMPDAAESLARARSIDDTCASLDIQIAVHVVHREALPMLGAQIKGAALAAGLQFREDGIFTSGGASGANQFTMSSLGALPFVAAEMDAQTTHGITFWLDVPRVTDAAAVFDRMIAGARQIATSLGGVLVDDNRSPLSDAMLLDIRTKIIEIQQNMSAQGIPPGGTRALRLFA
jgi:FtsZ-interacting cell division protein ZipA